MKTRYFGLRNLGSRFQTRPFFAALMNAAMSFVPSISTTPSSSSTPASSARPRDELEDTDDLEVSEGVANPIDRRGLLLEHQGAFCRRRNDNGIEEDRRSAGELMIGGDHLAVFPLGAADLRCDDLQPRAGLSRRPFATP